MALLVVEGAGVHVFLQGCHRCFTSTVAVCSRRVGRPTPVPNPRGREYWGAMPAEGGCRVATIRGVQEPWRREGGRIGEGRVRARVMSFKAVSDLKKKKRTERIKAAAQEIHAGTTGHLDA